MRLPKQSAILPLLALCAGDLEGAQWNVDHERSKLGFIASYDGVGFETVFRRFTASIRFDAQHTGDALFDVRVDVDSVDSNSADRDDGMRGEEWFSTARFPSADFVSTAVRQTGASMFQLDGRLTIKGVTRDVTLPFFWNQDRDRARMQANTVLRRTDYAIGTGEWATDPIIGFDVEVFVELHLLAETSR